MQFQELDQESIGNIQVVCRFRPLNDKERENSSTICALFPSSNTVQILPQDQQPLNFKLDRIFPPSTTQLEIYEHSGRPVVESVMEGFNGTIFAYGQTASGKTFTMTGDQNDRDKMGITPRMEQSLTSSTTRLKNLNLLSKFLFAKFIWKKSVTC